MCCFGAPGEGADTGIWDSAPRTPRKLVASGIINLISALGKLYESERGRKIVWPLHPWPQEATRNYLRAR
mgnify:CR=1 FL=1